MIIILPFTQDHLEQVLEIEVRDGDAHWSRNQFEQELGNEIARFFVLTEDTDVIGFGGYWKAADEAQITNLVIRQDHRCQGLGRRLLEFMLDCARGEGCRTSTLEVRQNNLHAQALYKEVGFASTGTRPGVYHDPEDSAVLMEKNL